MCTLDKVAKIWTLAWDKSFESCKLVRRVLGEYIRVFAKFPGKCITFLFLQCITPNPTSATTKWLYKRLIFFFKRRVILSMKNILCIKNDNYQDVTLALQAWRWADHSYPQKEHGNNKMDKLAKGILFSWTESFSLDWDSIPTACPPGRLTFPDKNACKLGSLHLQANLFENRKLPEWEGVKHANQRTALKMQLWSRGLI